MLKHEGLTEKKINKGDKMIEEERIDEIDLMCMKEDERLEYMYKKFKSIKKEKGYGKKKAISRLNYKLHTVHYDLVRANKANDGLKADNQRLNNIIEYLQDRIEEIASSGGC